MKSLSVLIVIAAIMGLTVERVSNIYQRLIVSSLQTTPTINGFSPTTGAPGTNVTITGSGFISPSAGRDQNRETKDSFHASYYYFVVR